MKLSNKDYSITSKDKKNTSGLDKKALLTEMKYLATSWLDDFERQQFGGKTINQLLKGGSYE
jgi:hypothetical protein